MTDEKINKFVEDCAIGVVIATIGISAVILFQRFSFVGDEASLGDLLTFGSILGAAWIAKRGWSRADRIAQEERERIAKAECAIFYRKYRFADRCSIAFFVTFFLDFDEVIFDLNDRSVEEIDYVLLRHFGQLRMAMTGVLREFPDTGGAHEHLSKAYQYSDEIGELLSETIATMDELEKQLRFFTNLDSDTFLQDFRSNPHVILNHYYGIFAHFSAVPKRFETIRRHTSIDKFDSNIRSEILIELRRCFESAFGIEFVAADPATNPDAFLDMHTKMQDEFQRRSTRYQNHVVANLVANGAN